VIRRKSQLTGADQGQNRWDLWYPEKHIRAIMGFLDRRALLALFLVSASLPLAAADDAVKVGGVDLTLPAPEQKFVEVGDKLRTTLFYLLVPSTNRLLAVYVLPEALANLNAGKSAGGLDSYAMAEVPRRAEYLDCTPQAFGQVIKGMEPMLGKADAVNVHQVEQELNDRLKAAGAKPIEVGHPEILGNLFHKPDAAGYAMLMAVSNGDRSVKMAAGIAFMRVRQRIIFVYLYRKYESPDTVTGVSKNLEAWVDSILARNK
jgi:hypothetical protein